MLTVIRRSWRGGAKLGVTAVVLAVVAVLFSTAGAPPARADLQNPRQIWLRQSQAGLFLHWGERTSPAQTSCSAWQTAVNKGWKASKWVDAAIQLHASYIVLAAFHSRLGYARAWPSKIPGTCSTTRDYLGELITEAHRRGVKVINYMTDDPQHHAENGFEYFNSGAYSKFKGRTINLSTRDGFGEFSYDNFFEVMRNHPDLDGFWIDNDNAFWERHHLYEQIHAMHPNMVLSNNNEDTAEMDTVSNEQKTGMTPSYDYPQATWSPAPRLTEADYKLPSKGAWWFDGDTANTASVDRKLSIGRFVTNAGSSIKSLMAETAKQNGDLPDPQVSFNGFVNSWVSPIWEAFDRTEGGGYMYGGMQAGRWNDGAYGVTTIKQDNPNLQYIHVIDRPSGSTLRVRDNGYHVTKVTNVRSRAAVSFSQSKGVLTLTGVSSWDQFDTVFRVETSGRVGIYPAGSVSSSATASKGGFPASNLTDGSYLNFWDNNGRMPVTITLDLGSAKRVEYLGVNQREWSVSYNRSSSEQSARIKGFHLSVSTDGSTWTPVKTGTLPSARGVQLIDVNVGSARFVRLQVDSTYAASSATKFFHQLRIDEMFVGGSYA